MSTNYRRFNNSTSENYNNNTKLENGNLSWDDSNGLRLHDGTTLGGNPVIGIHERWDTLSQVTSVNPNNGTFAIIGDQTAQGWAQAGQILYYERDIDENPQTITDKSYDSGNDLTVFTVNNGYHNNYSPKNGEYIYRNVHPTNINQLAEGDGIDLSLNNKRVTVSQRFFGQSSVQLNDYTLANGVQLNTLEGSLIVVTQDPNYTNGTPGEQHNLTLPFDFMQSPYWSPDARLTPGTRVTVINQSQFNLNVSGWPAPGWTVPQFGSVELIYYYEADYGGNLWWVTSAFSWP